MKKPKLEIDFKDLMQKEYKKTLLQILIYIAKKNNIKELDEVDMSVEMEKVKNYSVPIKTYRYKGEEWLRAYPKGVTPADGFIFISPLIK